MGWYVSDDAKFYEQARAFQTRAGSRWWVMWSPGRHCYTGFFCGPADVTPIDVPPDSDRDFLKELRYAELRATWPNPNSHPHRRGSPSGHNP